MNDNIKAAELLESAAFVIQLPGWWTRGYLAESATDSGIAVDDPSACAFCVMGAMYAARVNTFSLDLAESALRDVLGGMSYVWFNDEVAKSGKEVAYKMLEAADMLRNQS